jgi:polysaccharide biosynthesis/export protein
VYLKKLYPHLEPFSADSTPVSVVSDGSAQRPYSLRMISYPPVRPVLLVVFVLMVIAVPLAAQIVTGEGPRHPGTTGDPAPVDTSSLREGRIRTEETAGLFEGPIDPDRYRVGPADLFTISIISSRALQQDVEVSPDGKLLVPSVGNIDVRGKTLSQVESAVIAAAGRVYTSANVAVSLRRMRRFKVHVTGAVLTPSTVVAAPTTRVSEAIALAGGASSQAETRRINVRHRDGSTTQVDLLPFYTVGERTSNPELQDGDVVIVPFQDEKAVVQVFGAVQRPGEYSFKSADSISSIIRYALGTTAEANRDSIEVVSVDARGQIVERTYHTISDEGTISNDRTLRPGDRVFVRALPGYLKIDRVVIKGEVVSPGSYAIERGSTKLRDLIASAGGFESDASLEDASLFRRRLAGEVDPRLAMINSLDPEKWTKDQIDYRLQKLREINRPGEMTVDFVGLMRGDDSQNLVLMDDDSIFVPERKGVIRVNGKVNNPGAVTFREGLTYRDYITLAGGYGWKADDGATEIVKEGSGEVFLASNDDSYRLEPGDEVWVPEERPSNLGEVFTTGLTILAQVATIIAVVVSIRASNSNGN